MEKVTGIGGVFFKADDPKKLADWYRDCLGLDFPFEHHAMFTSKGGEITPLAIFRTDTTYFAPSTKPFMINLRVASMEKMLAQLKRKGANVLDNIDDTAFGKFLHLLDIEGNKIQLWEPRPEQRATAKKKRPAQKPTKKKTAAQKPAKQAATKKKR